MARFPFAWRWSDNDVDAGQLVYPLIASLHISCSGHSNPFTQSSQSCHGLSGRPKAPSKSFCPIRATLTRSTKLILLQEMILDHFTQMLLCEENGHRTSL